MCRSNDRVPLPRCCPQRCSSTTVPLSRGPVNGAAQVTDAEPAAGQWISFATTSPVCNAGSCGNAAYLVKAFVMHNATLISPRNVRATASDLNVAESALWLASITDSVVEAVVGALAAAALAGLAFLFRSRRRKTKAVIELPLSNMADDRRFKFGLRHVRDGTDQAADRGPLVNTIHWFKKVDGDNTRLVVRLRYAKALGVQFKCFAEYSEMDFEQAANLLGQEEAIGTIDSEGAPVSNRAWFLLPSYRRVNTSDGFANNFIDPA
jgi:hypothetical protein